MWLEEMVWLWGPSAGGLGLWVIWRMLTLHAEVRALRRRVERLEADKADRHSQRSAAYS
jgi:uncharacterized protein YbjT (DUF2867 family)